ncbi:SseB family protein [Microbacterium sp. zg.Y1090]|uniref:SseB family protein n=1 Tax=Microbacterium TaxID=33882 RepID=UPI00214B5ED0|nr:MULTISPECIES: SseB family protein [unclassified Microbacterium]MCR2814061.1 SseB family protein [Microbacterium sp. zg.Y1084]MCR2817934.1 SseB family protein [Microbacterium sp. zg.Y1090]MDL5487788.1 SseB family protein [Microbacterium sp. zg-Y1211]WIM27901.1 SseB family protein [Microbacterium sp. zg-Y1090]
MALFSRRDKNPATDGDAPAAPAASAQAATSEPDAAAPVEAVPQVNISMSTFGKAARPAPEPLPEGARRTLRGPAEAPARTETVPGLPDNMLVRAAVAAMPEQPQPVDIIALLRQLLQGHLYVRVRGDAKAQLAEGKELTMAVSALGDDRYLLAFTGGDALQDSVSSDGDAQTSAMGQPSGAVLRNVVSGPYAGIIIDHASPGRRAVLPKALIEKALSDADPAFTLKNLLAAERTEATAAAVGEALARTRVWVAAGEVPGAEKRMGVSEVRAADGSRRLEVFSHPLEVAVLGRNDRAVPLSPEQLGKAIAADEGLTGVVVDPGGPWIMLDRPALAPVIALAG